MKLLKSHRIYIYVQENFHFNESFECEFCEFSQEEFKIFSINNSLYFNNLR